MQRNCNFSEKSKFTEVYILFQKFFFDMNQAVVLRPGKKNVNVE